MQLDRRLWRFTAGVRGRIVASALIGVAAAVAGVARLALLGWLLAGVLRGEPLADLAVPILLVGAVMLLRGGLEYWRAMAAHRTAAIVQLNVRHRIYEHVIALGPAHFGLTRTGDVLLALVDGVEQLETYFGQYLPQLFVAAVTPIGIFAFAAMLDLPVAAILLGFALFSLIAPSAFHKWDSDSSLRRQKAYGDFAAEFLDSVQGLATLKAFGQSRARVERLAAKAREVFRATMWVLATNALSRGITDTGIALGAAAALGYGAYRVHDGAMTLDALLVILMMGVEVFRPMRDLRGMLHQGMLGAGAAEGIFAVLNARPIVAASAAPAAPATDFSPVIEFDDVTFRYPNAQQSAHDGLSFRIAAGERVGVIGASGAGKTSIIRLLLRLYDPDFGTVRVGDRDVRHLDLDTLRRRIAVVSQDTYLFHGTVEDNLRFGKPDASHAELRAAAEAANAHGFISRLPDGYATVIGERGIRLSGGQRQRIAIARALLRDAPILVLDEALSAVDAENEAVIQQALDRLMRGRTTLISAHRLSSVIDCDRIFVLDRGRIVESGDHTSLLARGGEYARLMGAQAAEDAEAVLLDDEPAPDDGTGLPATLPHPSQSVADRPTDAILRAEGMGWGRLLVEMMRLIMPWKGRLTATFGLGVIRVLAFIGVGVLSALVVAALKGGGAFDALVVALLAIAPLAGILHWIESWIAHDMAYRLLSEMRIALFDKLERLAPAYMLRRRTGDLVAMATQDVETVEYFFAHTVAPAFVAILIPATVLITLVAYGLEMALALIPFLLVVGIGPWVVRRRVDEIASRAREALAALNAHAVDTIQGLAEIVAFQQAERRGAEFVALIRKYNAVRLPFFRDLTLQTVILEVATGLGGLAVVATGASLVAAGRLDAATMPLLTLLAMAAFLPVSEIADIGRQLADTLGATRRLYAVHDEPVPVTDGPGVPGVPGAPGAPGGVGASGQAATDLQMDQVAFAYDEAGAPAVRDVSLDVPAGATVALVGPSGAGKSTIAHLLMRFFDPRGGTIRMGGVAYTRFKLDDLRRRIALVTQDTYLFNETLRANILLGRPDAADDEVAAAVDRAALSDFVRSLPDGLETRVGERGVRLSGGQRQRIAIARAFLKDAPVLILDEATSHLDAANEQAVRRSLAALTRERTTLVIAHRLSTVRDADLIAVLDEGRLVETGTHEQLLARGGIYARLVSRQMSAGRAPTAAD